jgi:hypothetical protein
MPYTQSLVGSGGRAAPITADFSEATAAEVVAEGSEAFALEGASLSPHWSYSATAEDNGTAGALDGQPGVVFSGPVTQAVRVSVSGLQLLEGAIQAPEATDSFVGAVFKNSTQVATLATEAGTAIITELDTETAVVLEGDVIVDAVSDGDVIRIGVVGLTDETYDLDVALGGAVSIG